MPVSNTVKSASHRFDADAPVEAQSAQDSKRLPSSALSSTFLYIIVFCQGLAQLFSSNTIMNSSHFFVKRVSDTGHGHFVMEYILVILCSAKFFFLILSSLLLRYLTPFRAAFVSQIGKAAIFVVLGTLACLDKVSSGNFFALVLCMAFMGSIFGIMSFLAIFHILARLRPTFSQAFCAGQSSAGIITSILKVLTILWAPSNSDTGVMVYFFITAIVILGSTLLFAFAKRLHGNPVGEKERERVAKEEEILGKAGSSTEPTNNQMASPFYLAPSRSVSPPSMSDSSGYHDGAGLRSASAHTLPLVKRRAAAISESRRIMEQGCSTPLAFYAPLRSDQLFSADKPDLDEERAEEHRAAARVAELPSPAPAGKRAVHALWRHYQVCRAHCVYFGCIFLHYFQGLFLVPNFCYLTKSTHAHSSALALYSHELFPVFTFLLYHVGDWIARFLIGFRRFQPKRRFALYAGVGATFAFFPIFVFGNIRFVDLQLKAWPRFLASDAFFCCMITLFGAVNGYLSTALIMLGPELSPDSRDKQIISSLIVCCLSLGLLLGAVATLLFKIMLYSYS